VAQPPSAVIRRRRISRRNIIPTPAQKNAPVHLNAGRFRFDLPWQRNYFFFAAVFFVVFFETFFLAAAMINLLSLGKRLSREYFNTPLPKSAPQNRFFAKFSTTP